MDEPSPSLKESGLWQELIAQWELSPDKIAYIIIGNV